MGCLENHMNVGESKAESSYTFLSKLIVESLETDKGAQTTAITNAMNTNK
jgi:hypothetical protein